MQRPTIPPLRSSLTHSVLAAGLAAFALASVFLPATPAAAQDFGGPPKAKLELIADRTSYPPGATATVAARVTIDEGWHINSHEPTFEWLIPTEMRIELPDGWGDPLIVYPPHVMKTFAFEDEPLAVYEGEAVVRITLTIPESVARDGVTDVPLDGTLFFQACDDHSCLPPADVTDTVHLAIGELGEPVEAALFDGSTGTPSSDGPARPAQSLALMLALGVLGGLILNAMPCVLPVLSLKIFGMVKSAGQGRGAVVGGSLATALGILLSFWALAGTAVAARAAGAAVGWGVQFQNPVFVVFLLVVVMLFCLNLWGLFEIPLPQLVARAAGSGPSEGVAGHLASGLFATLMATPCSAPFLGTAIAFALAQPAGVIFAIFTAVGFGMALPYLVLAAAPRLAGLLPKPGAWMDTLRKVMGFLLAAAAIWLLYVLASQVSREARAWIELSMLGMALLVWLRQRALEGAFVKRLADLGVVAVALGALAIGWQANAAQAATVQSGDEGGLIEWVDFDRDRAESLANEGVLVFVDVTADWCFTCKYNERLVIETEQVADAFERHAVVPMRADWTNRNDTIARFLADHGRYGIPFYMLYRPGDEPHVFSELLTKDRLIEVLESAATDGTPLAESEPEPDAVSG